MDKPVVFELTTLLEYTFEHVRVLGDMVRVAGYHGNTSDAINGLHGFNLCDDKSIRHRFHTELSLEERQRILQVTLVKRSFEGSTCLVETVVEDYFRWRTQRTEILYRCLQTLHMYMFKRENPTIPPACNFKNSRQRICVLLWLRYEKSLKTSEGYTFLNSFKEITAYRYIPKRVRFIEQADHLLTVMERYVLDFQAHYTVLPAITLQRQKDARPQKTTPHKLYMNFQRQHKDLLDKSAWGKCAFCLFYVFKQLSFPRLVNGKVCYVFPKDWERDPNEEPMYLERSMPE
jgi:hypothetical protein